MTTPGANTLAFPRPDRAEVWLVRWVIVFWAVLIAAHCGRAFLIPWSERHLTIYPVYHTAGRAWLAGEDLYHTRDSYDTFRYSPLAAALLVPCGMQSIIMGCFTWRVFNVALFLAGLVAMERTCFASWSASRRSTFYLLAGLAGASGLIDAVANAPVVGLTLLSLAGALRSRWNLSAVCMALAVLLKIYPVAAALLFVLIWPRQFGWRFGVALLAGLGLPFLLQDPSWVYQQYQGWFHVVSLDKGRQDWPLDMSYRDLRLLFRVWATPLPSWMYLAIQLTAAATLAGVTLRAKRLLGPGPRLGFLVLGLAVCWMLVLGPSTEGTTYVLIAPFLAWAVVDAWGAGSGRWTRGYATAACVLMIVSCAAVWFPGGKRFHNFGPHPVCAMLVAGYLIHRLVEACAREGRVRQAAPLPLREAV